MRQLENQVKKLTAEKMSLEDKIQRNGQFILPFEADVGIFFEKLNQGFNKKLIKQLKQALSAQLRVEAPGRSL